MSLNLNSIERVVFNMFIAMSIENFSFILYHWYMKYSSYTAEYSSYTVEYSSYTTEYSSYTTEYSSYTTEWIEIGMSMTR